MKLHCFVSVLSVFVNKRKWFSGLHLVVLFFLLFCAQFVVFCFLFLSNPKKRTQQKQKNNHPEKKDNEIIQLAQLCSQILFILFGVGYKHVIFC